MVWVEARAMDTDIIDCRPRSMVYEKMERILQNMQNSDNGLPLKTFKNFTSSVSDAFTGSEFVSWLADHVMTDDRTEALQLAASFSRLGYIYPISDIKTSLKDDNSLYRFQTPYFWPSMNLRPNYVEYAIYLTKRSLRSKQKHGLDENEQVTLAKLQKMLCDKWDFIYMQAQEQVRLLKERKKADKQVLTSQERAFWKVQSAIASQTNISEMERRNGQRENPQRKSLDTSKKQVQFLESRLKQPRMKLSKVFEGLAHRCELYNDHDPFLVQPLPSNPWITDDSSKWSNDVGLTEHLTERRVTRWSFGLGELLRDPAGLKEFESFLNKEFSMENVRFWMAVEEMKRLPLSQLDAKAKQIFDEFLASGAPSEINVDSHTVSETNKQLLKPTRLTYDSAQEHIYLLMKKDSYPRFLRSDQYKKLLDFAKNTTTQKKIFNFGSRKQNKTQSPKIKRRGSASRLIHPPPVDDLLGTNTLSQHSYSTGNLIDIEPYRSGKSTPFGSSGSIAEQNAKRFSPVSIRKKLEDFFLSPMASPHRTKLEVPQHHFVNHITVESDCPTHTVNISVPCCPKNVIVPWENEASDSLDSGCAVNVVQTAIE